MTIFDVMANYPSVFAAMSGVAGVLVGSFLNVVIYRLPVMIEREVESYAREILELPVKSNPEPFSLSRPNSSCPCCGHAIRPWENIPVLSWLFLRGRCSSCKGPISSRYPIIEVLTGLLSWGIASHFGYGLSCLFGLVLTWGCLALFVIDLDEMLLPDAIVLPGIWVGLAAGYLGLFTSLENAFIGAVVGYLIFAVPVQVISWVTGRDGMGGGDLKLMALMGAWLGWQMLPVIVLLSTVAGAVVGVVVRRKRGASMPYPFGPFIIAAGLIALVWGHEIYAWYAKVSGIRIGAPFIE